jgi:hypothetical protein
MLMIGIFYVMDEECHNFCLLLPQKQQQSSVTEDLCPTFQRQESFINIEENVTVDMSSQSESSTNDNNEDEDKENSKIKRIEAFREFMTNIPRHFSPSMLPPIDGNGDLKALPIKESFDGNYEFNWSINQIALLNPADFSSDRNESFFEGALSVSVNERFAQECQDFFNQSKILPSPESGNPSANTSTQSVQHRSSPSFNLLPRQCMTSNTPSTAAAAAATTGLLQPYFSLHHHNGRSPQSFNLSSIPTAAYSVYSPFHKMTTISRTTPDRGDKDMSVTESKLPTPVNGSKARRKKSKLFVDEVSGQQHLMPLEEDSNSCSTTNDDDTTEYDLRSDSITAFCHNEDKNLAVADLALSPIQAFDEDARQGDCNVIPDFNETDEAFSRDILVSMETSTQFDSQSQVTASMADMDSGCIDKSRKNCFIYKTSTPSQPERNHH